MLLRSHRATLPDDELVGLPVETSIEAALAHKPDAIVISNPTALHLDVADSGGESRRGDFDGKAGFGFDDGDG